MLVYICVHVYTIVYTCCLLYMCACYMLIKHIVCHIHTVVKHLYIIARDFLLLPAEEVEGTQGLPWVVGAVAAQHLSQASMYIF